MVPLKNCLKGTYLKKDKKEPKKQNKADHHKSRARDTTSHYAKKSKAGWTDRPTDRRTDTVTCRVACTRLKIEISIFFENSLKGDFLAGWSVGLSVGRSVGPSVRRSVGRSVGNTLLFSIFLGRLELF